MQNEQEFKWHAQTRADFKAFINAAQSMAALVRAQGQNIRDVYYDSPEGYYGAKRLSCRIRRVRAAYVLTLKSAGKTVRGMHVREEKNFPLNAKSLPAAIKKAKQFLPQKNIKKIFSINNKRAVFKITKPFKAEICLDDFTVICGAKKVHKFEIELEFKSGDLQKFKIFAAQTAQLSKLKPSATSKVKTALSLLSPRLRTAPQKAT